MDIFTGHDSKIICMRPICPTCDGRTLMRLARNDLELASERDSESS